MGWDEWMDGWMDGWMEGGMQTFGTGQILFNKTGIWTSHHGEGTFFFVLVFVLVVLCPCCYPPVSVLAFAGSG